MPWIKVTYKGQTFLHINFTSHFRFWFVSICRTFVVTKQLKRAPSLSCDRDCNVTITQLSSGCKDLTMYTAVTTPRIAPDNTSLPKCLLSDIRERQVRKANRTAIVWRRIRRGEDTLCNRVASRNNCGIQPPICYYSHCIRQTCTYHFKRCSKDSCWWVPRWPR